MQMINPNIMNKYETTGEIERAVGDFFKPRVNLVVPNVSWGFFVHECDLYVLTKAGYGIEVEIKVSKADLIKDKNKGHGHHSVKIKKLFFAIPERLHLPEIVAHIPERAGIIVVNTVGRCKVVRPAQINGGAKKLDDTHRQTLLRLAYLRYWDSRFNRERVWVGEGEGI